jgi:peptide/nickel transport system ATP-binding protein
VTRALLEIEDLGLEIPGDPAPRPLLRGVSLSIGVGEVLSLVGESGSGKSVTARAVLGLLPRGARTTGSVRFEGRSVLDASPDELRSYRARKVGMVFQDPRAYINPVRRIGSHLTEAATSIAGMRRSVARSRAIELLDAVQIDEPRRIMDRFPHELSGGMLQRVMIAGALMGEPELLLADEPTTALDVTTQAEVMVILARLRKEFDLAMLFITHDLELAAATADRTAVMYAGRIVEQQPSTMLHGRPLHPYTVGLLGSIPRIDAAPDRLLAIKGRPIAAADAPDGCAFEPRCPFARDRCRREDPTLRGLLGGEVACLFAEEIQETRTPSHA